MKLKRTKMLLRKCQISLRDFSPMTQTLALALALKMTMTMKVPMPS